jgi:predicted mannosyl-3-phosphoglycerate phosphatase (HAD superfamily)
MDKFVAKGIKIAKDNIVATGEPFLSVSADIYNGEELLETKKYGFPFGTTSEVVKEEIKKSLSTLRSELDQAEKNKERDALEKEADKAIEEITDLNIEE